jgi:hypothetical protein
MSIKLKAFKRWLLFVSMPFEAEAFERIFFDNVDNTT